MTLAEQCVGMVLTIDDAIPPAGPFCAWGVRYWFTLQGLNFREFMKSGIPAERLLATGDHLAESVVIRKLRGQHGK